MKEKHVVPHNYRDISITIDGKTLLVGAMAHPIRYGFGYSLQEITDFWAEKNVGTVISFSDLQEAEIYTDQEIRIKEQLLFKNKENQHYSIPIVDKAHVVPSLEEFDALYEIFKKSPQNIILYCGEGLGRSGVMLASLVLRQLIQENITNPESLQEYAENEKENNQSILGCKCSSLVYKAIKTIRALPGSNTYKSIENYAQVQALCDLEKEILNSIKNPELKETKKPINLSEWTLYEEKKSESQKTISPSLYKGLNEASFMQTNLASNFINLFFAKYKPNDLKKPNLDEEKTNEELDTMQEQLLEENLKKIRQDDDKLVAESEEFISKKQLVIMFLRN